jgi:hypothetical protein
MSSTSNPTSNLESLLHNACCRAMEIGLSFTNQVRLYRSIVALAREVRLRFGGVLFDQGSQTLAALLAAVCERASETGLAPELPLPDAILLQRLAAQLSRAARRAGGPNPAEQQFFVKNPLHAEDPSESASTEFFAHIPVRHEEPAQPQTPEPAAEECLAQNLIQPEDEAADDRLRAWRKGHTAERDRRAQERPRTASDDRAISKIEAMNKRDRGEWAASARAEAA